MEVFCSVGTPAPIPRPFANEQTGDIVAKMIAGAVHPFHRLSLPRPIDIHGSMNQSSQLNTFVVVPYPDPQLGKQIHRAEVISIVSAALAHLVPATNLMAMPEAHSKMTPTLRYAGVTCDDDLASGVVVRQMVARR